MTFGIDEYVELIEGREQIYHNSRPGQRGWVRSKRVDEWGFPQVYIEWDKSDSRYGGEMDGWTYESHFQPVKVNPHAKASTRDACPSCGHIHDSEADEIENYLEQLNEGIDAALGGDGYLLITVGSQNIGDKIVYTPYFFSATRTEEATAMLEAQLMHLASNTYQEAVIERLNRMKDKG